MATASVALVLALPVVVPPRATLKFRVLREGVVTPGVKTLFLYRGWGSVATLAMVFQTLDGEWTRAEQFDLATLLAQGEWLVAGEDLAAPRRTRATYLTFTESAELTFDITSGEGGVVGEPATLAAQVRVDQQPAGREVVVIERPLDGQWRVAGYGLTVDGEAELELRVAGGLCYAVAVDDWGVLYSPTLAVTVGQTIRPTLFTGWLYRVTEAGTLPATEPEWWPADGENAARLIGTARAIAVRYYAPIGHGPVPIEVI